MSEKEIKISIVPPDHIRKVWEHVSEYVKTAAKYTYGRMGELDILHFCLTGRYHLWVVYKQGEGDKEEDLEYIGVAATEIYEYPQKKALLVNFLSGDSFSEWMPEMDKKFVEYAKITECDFVEACGRSGWERKVKKLGWIKRFSLIERPLT